MTFVKVRLQIEKMSPGEILEIRLTGPEPLKNVPESVTELGHALLGSAPEDAETQTGPDSVFRLRVRKN